MSLLFAPVERCPELIARLHINAVLPAFRVLLEQSDKARTILGKKRFLLHIKCADLEANLLFNKGRCRITSRPKARPSVSLRFLSYQHLNRSFSGDALAIPLPTRGIHRIGTLYKFSNLSKLLQERLLTAGEPESRERAIYLRLSLQVALASVVELIGHEPFSSRLFREMPDWSVGFKIEGSDFESWIGCQNNKLYLQKHAPAKPMACIQFSGSEIAYQSLEGMIDSMTAINHGKIRITGKLPLVERLSLVLERVPFYLKPSMPS